MRDNNDKLIARGEQDIVFIGAKKKTGFHANSGNFA